MTDAVYRRILVAVDGSETAALALVHAVALAREQRAQLRVVHVVDTGGYMTSAAAAYPFDITPLQDGLRQEGAACLAQAEATARQAGVDVQTALLEDPELATRVAKVIGDDARRADADLIVMGTHGRRGLARLFIGSVAEALVRVADRPVLLVRSQSATQ